MKIEIKPLGRTLGSIKTILPKIMEDRLKQEGITYTFGQMVVLLIVELCPKAQQEIAEILNRDKSVILRNVDALENDGLLCRTCDPNDRRRNNINLTDKGYEYIEKYRVIETEITKELLSGLKDEEIEVFYKVVNHINETAKTM